jgi:hypothetical protein
VELLNYLGGKSKQETVRILYLMVFITKNPSMFKKQRYKHRFKERSDPLLSTNLSKYNNSYCLLNDLIETVHVKMVLWDIN